MKPALDNSDSVDDGRVESCDTSVESSLSSQSSRSTSEQPARTSQLSQVVYQRKEKLELSVQEQQALRGVCEIVQRMILVFAI